MFAMGVCPREGCSREMSAESPKSQNEPTGMISSRLNAGFKFVSDSVIDLVCLCLCVCVFSASDDPCT